MHLALKRSIVQGLAMLACAASFWGCAQDPEGEVLDLEEQSISRAPLTAEERLDRLRHIQRETAKLCLQQGWLVAGISQHEMRLAHCYGEGAIATCRGPATDDCESGYVAAGSGDGRCSNKQGGLGMFQLDGGTYTQTVAREGRAVLSVDGNIERGIIFIIDQVVKARILGNRSATDEEAIAWMNEVLPGTAAFETYVDKITQYYNGCVDLSRTVCKTRRAEYKSSLELVYDELGSAHWMLDASQSEACGIAVENLSR